MSAHTPGPWKMIDHDVDHIAITDDLQGFGICKLEEVASESRASMVANARLIASAPDLVKAVRLALGEFSPNECSCEETTEAAHACYFHRIERELKMALFKAAGGDE